jgi:predicted permease
LLALLAAVGFVLLVASANLANLMLARTTGRVLELAVRKALGAPVGRVARQLLMEGAVLSAAGVVVGLALARAGIVVAEALLPATLPGAQAVRLDGRVVLATVVAATAATLLASLFPTLRAARAAPSSVLGERAGTDGRALVRTQAGLLVAEVALAVLLVAAAALAGGTVRALLDTGSGYRTEGVMTMMAVPPSDRYGDAASRLVWWDEALAALRALPGVTAAGGIHLAPFGGGDWSPELLIEDLPVAPDEARPEVGWRVVTPGWFETAGVPLVAGRDFDERDRADGIGVAIVNETLARRFWPEGSALGRRVRTFFEDGEWVEIVGVVGDTRDVALDRDLRPQMYRPYTQFPTGSMMLAARSRGAASTLAASMRSALQAVDEDVPILDPATLAQRVGTSVARERLVARLLGTFAMLALLLGAVGIYGVTAHAVGRRRHELGVRSALGASGPHLVRMVLGQTTRVAAVGAAVGLALAVVAGRVAAARIANLAPPGPLLLTLSVAALLGVALLAAWIPARRAALTDPRRTLRED